MGGETRAFTGLVPRLSSARPRDEDGIVTVWRESEGSLTEHKS